jgi:molybdenum-dependent DNA-binding transcriptional regulator ModE
MKQQKELSLERRTRITAIGDMLIERYVEQKEALEAGDRAHAIALQFEIKELQHEKEKVAKSVVSIR